MKMRGWSGVVRACVILALAGCAGRYRGWVASASDNVTVYTEARIEHELMQEWLELSHAAYRAFFPEVSTGRVDAVWLKDEPGSGTRVFRPNDDPRAGWTLEGLPRSERIGRQGLIVLERLDDVRATRDEGVAKRQMAHLFVMKAVPQAPLWLQVGLSRYLAKFRIHRPSGSAGGQGDQGGGGAGGQQKDSWLACFGGAAFDEPPEINLVPGARSGRRVSTPLDEVLGADWYEYDGHLRYWYEYTAYALVHYLIHGEGGSHQSRFPVLLRALRQGKSSEEALAIAYPHILPDEWEERLATHVRPPMGAAWLAATPQIVQGLCLPIPPAERASAKPRRLPADPAEVQTLLEDLEQVEIFRRHSAWFPRDIVDAEAAKRPRPRRPGGGQDRATPPGPDRGPVPTVTAPGPRPR
jgi:hypothetical protein